MKTKGARCVLSCGPLIFFPCVVSKMAGPGDSEQGVGGECW